MKCSRRRGSFIVEALVATVILSCGLVVVIRAYLSAITVASIEAHYTTAIILLNDELDALMSKGLAASQTAGTRRVTNGREIFDITIGLSPVTGRDLLFARLTVNWPAGARDQRTVSAATYVLAPASENAHE